MGLFKKKSDEQLIAEDKEKIINEGSTIIYLSIGTHGADEVVAGAMMGETGKLIAMGKYGKTKWQGTYLYVSDEGLRIHYNGFECTYDEFIGFELLKKGWLDYEFLFKTKNYNFLCKVYSITYQALVEIIDELKPRYMEKLAEEAQRKETAQAETITSANFEASVMNENPFFR